MPKNALNVIVTTILTYLYADFTPALHRLEEALLKFALTYT